jgi:hypothetical protein
MSNENFFEKALEFLDPNSKYYVEEVKYPKKTIKNIDGEVTILDGDIPVQSVFRDASLAKKMKLRKDDTFVIG